MGGKYNRDNYQKNREKHIAYMLKRYHTNKELKIITPILNIKTEMIVLDFS